MSQGKVDEFFRSTRRGVKRDIKEFSDEHAVKKSLISEQENASPSEALTQENINLPYKAIRQLFEKAHIEEVFIGREMEMATIASFWQSALQSPCGSTLYISGVPGNGKTATIQETIKRMRVWQKQQKLPATISFYNCMTIVNLVDFFDAMKEKCTDGCRHVLILDEIDQLAFIDEHNVYSFFEWCVRNPSVTLIGISNSLDLTDRIVPRLKVKEVEPQLLHYKPYTFEHIRGILQHRAAKSAFEMFDPLAIEYCARRAAAIQGDLRKAFDICRSALDIVEKDALLKFNQKEISTRQQLPKVKIYHIQKVIDVVFGNPLLQKITQLPIRQKYLLYMLVQMTERQDELTFQALFETYQKFSQTRRLDGIAKCELNEVCASLENAGIIDVDIKDKFGLHHRRLCLNLQTEDVRHALGNIILMSVWGF